jgi:hypothetical protein
VESGLSSRPTSGLFPSGPQRPTYREPHPVRPASVALGAGVAAVWLLLFGLFAASVRGYAWLTIFAATLAWLVAIGLVRLGDRGAATGVAISAGLGLAAAWVVVIIRWATTGWPLW